VAAYLNYAGIGLVREPARAAMHAAVDEVLTRGAPEYGRFFAARDAARRAAARLLEAEPEEIALVGNTSHGIQLVAEGLDWQAGDEIVVFDRDFPANVQPWRRLTRHGVVLRWVPMRAGGYELDDIAAAIGPATRLVAVSHVNFVTGFRTDLDEVCRLARSAGALVCVDAVQSLGVLPLSVARTPIDFLAAAGHKWLCAPPGTGLLYCRRDRMDLLSSAPFGWTGYAGATDVLHRGAGHLRYELPLLPDARRFEGGMHNFLGLVGLAATLEELLQIGVPLVTERVRSLTARLREALAERDCTVISPDGAAWSGIVSFVHSEKSAEDVHELLTAANCHVSHPDGKIRVAPHYWTADWELSQLLAVL
jgi:cysteine desulfurase / selenocysteine lyase